MKSSVVRHFEQAAGSYSAVRHTGLVGNLVKKEIAGIKEFLPEVRGKWVLDLGCGTGVYTELLRNAGAKVVAVDIAHAMAKRTQKCEPKVVVASITTVSFKRKFDVVVCGGALEFIPNQECAFRNVVSLLKPKGVFLAVYPRRSIGGVLYGWYHKIINTITITVLSDRSFDEAMTAAGLLLEDVKTVNFISCVLLARKI